MNAGRRKPTRKALKASCDRLFSQLVRAPGVCAGLGATGFWCGGNLQAAHIVSRRYLSVRWDFDNAIPLCQAHHVYWTHRVIEWEAWVEEEYPGRLADLKRRALEPWDKDLTAVLARLKAAGVVA